MIQKSALTLDDIKRMAAACEKEAQQNQWAVTFAIVDDGGHCGPVNAERVFSGTRLLLGRVTLVRPVPHVTKGCACGSALDEDRVFADDVDDKLRRVTAGSAAAGERE